MVQTIIDKLSEKSNISREEIDKKIQNKVLEFSGLVSEEGAAYLVAKELGMGLLEENEKKELKIANVLPGMRKVNIKGKVTKITDKNSFTKSDGTAGEVQSIVMGDETGSIRVVLWNEQTQMAGRVKIGEVIEIYGGYSRESMNGGCEVHLNKFSRVNKCENEDIEMVVASQISSREQVNIDEIKRVGQVYEFHGTIVNMNVKNPIYYSCSECGSKVSREGNVNMCESHGEVEPVKSLIISCFVDDGNGCIRCVYFRGVAKKLINVSDIEELNTEEVIKKCAECIGKEVFIRGSAKNNEFFGSIEIVVEEVEEINPIERMQSLMEVI